MFHIHPSPMPLNNPYEELKTMCEAIVERGIGATVEEIKS